MSLGVALKTKGKIIESKSMKHNFLNNSIFNSNQRKAVFFHKTCDSRFSSISANFYIFLK